MSRPELLFVSYFIMGAAASANRFKFSVGYELGKLSICLLSMNMQQVFYIPSGY